MANNLQHQNSNNYNSYSPLKSANKSKYSSQSLWRMQTKSIDERVKSVENRMFHNFKTKVAHQGNQHKKLIEKLEPHFVNTKRHEKTSQATLRKRKDAKNMTGFSATQSSKFFFENQMNQTGTEGGHESRAAGVSSQNMGLLNAKRSNNVTFANKSANA